MRQSQLFSKTSRTVSAEEVSVNARLLTQAGYVDKQLAGVYSFLPLGLRVVRRIEQIIRQEMNAIGGQELAMAALQPRELWQQTNRWHTPEEVMFKLAEPRGEPSVGLAWTHEEAITQIARRFISSYRDLPQAVYQFQTKFRNEPRAKSGIIRLREFAMKDLYSFHRDEADLDTYYERVKQAYLKIFERCGLRAMVVEASGGAFTKQYSHEFQVLTPAGEDTTVYCAACGFAQNREVAQGGAGERCPSCPGGTLELGRSVEVGNIFKLGTKFSQALGLAFTDEHGQQHPVAMASYGIGPPRVMGTIVEVHHDERGITWPAAVAPFQVHLLLLGRDAAVLKHAEATYGALTRAGCEVLYDDRPGSPGSKLKDADLIGIPWRAVVAAKAGDRLELKARTAGRTSLMSVAEVVNTVSVRS